MAKYATSSLDSQRSLDHERSVRKKDRVEASAQQLREVADRAMSFPGGGFTKESERWKTTTTNTWRDRGRDMEERERERERESKCSHAVILVN